MGQLLNAYSIHYVLIPKKGNRRWIFNQWANVVGVSIEEAIKNAQPLFEREKLRRLERALIFDRNFTGYDVDVKSVRKLLFYLPALTSEERVIPAFTYFGKGILDDD